MADTADHRPVLVIGRGHRPGRVSFGPEVLVEGVTRALAASAPNLIRHVEPRRVRDVLGGLLRRSTRIVHFLSTGRWSLLAPLIRFLLGKKVVTTYHGYAPIASVTGVRATVLQMISILQARAGLAGADTIVAVSRLLRERIAAPTRSRGVQVIPNGVGDMFLASSAPEREGRKPGDPLRLLIVGFGRHKGIEGVLDALRMLDGDVAAGETWRLTLLGVTPTTRPYLDLLRRRYDGMMQRVSVREAVEHEAMPAVYRDHDVLLLWSSHDSFGLVVPEAMATGVVPVVSDRVGAKDLIRHGETGLVVPYGDTQALAGAIRTLAAGGAAAISRDAMRAAAERASVRRTADAYRDLYRELLGPGPRVCFVTNICPPYRVGTFERLTAVLPIRFFFFADRRKELFWESDARPHPLRFNGTYIRGWTLPLLGTRWTPALYRKLLGERYDVLVKCINGKVPLALSFLLARLRGKRFVLWTGLWHHPSTPVHRLSRPVVRALYRRADAVVAYGPHVRAHLVGAGVDPARIIIAPQAVNNAAFGREVSEAELASAREESGFGSDPVILFVGRLEKHKGISVLLRACALLDDVPWQLVLIGEGKLRRTCEEEGGRLGPGRIRILGHVDNHRLPAYYRLATLLVLPSITTPEFREPWGLVTNEAFNQRCPVVVTTSVGAAAGGMVQDGLNGFVVPEDAPDALARALRRILEDPGLRDRLGEEGRRTVREWTQERMAAGFLEAIGRW